MRIGQECGQHWYSLHSWKICPLFRNFSTGFAFGPIMFIIHEIEE